MADLSIGTVVNLNPIVKTAGIAGETLTAGQSVYYKISDGRWYKAQATTLALSGYGTQVGICLVGGTVGTAVTIATSGDVDLGVSVTVGTIYVISAANAGGIAPWADLASTNLVTILGVGNAADIISMGVFASGIAHA